MDGQAGAAADLSSRQQYLSKIGTHIKGGFLIYPAVEKSYGWVFSYTSKLYAETGDMLHMLAGNGPVIVERGTGKLHTLGTANHPDISIAEFEREHGYAV